MLGIVAAAVESWDDNKPECKQDNGAHYVGEKNFFCVSTIQIWRFFMLALHLYWL